VAFTFAIIKTIKIGIASKHFGPIILSINAMMKVINQIALIILSINAMMKVINQSFSVLKP
jgi:hypothetical protein